MQFKNKNSKLSIEPKSWTGFFGSLPSTAFYVPFERSPISIHVRGCSQYETWSTTTTVKENCIYDWQLAQLKKYIITLGVHLLIGDNQPNGWLWKMDFADQLEIDSREILHTFADIMVRTDRARTFYLPNVRKRLECSTMLGACNVSVCVCVFRYVRVHSRKVN